MELKAVERRLAAILAADVVGYSRLMGAGEAGTHARLKSLRQELIEPVIPSPGPRLKADCARRIWITSRRLREASLPEKAPAPPPGCSA